MNRTNLRNNNRNSNIFSFRLSTANEVLERATAPKAKITVMHAVLYSDNARVFYLSDCHQKHAKIMLPKLEAFVLEAYSSNEISDVNLYYYLEENIQNICEAYIQAGKEIMPL